MGKGEGVEVDFYRVAISEEIETEIYALNCGMDWYPTPFEWILW